MGLSLTDWRYSNHLFLMQQGYLTSMAPPSYYSPKLTRPVPFKMLLYSEPNAVTKTRQGACCDQIQAYSIYYFGTMECLLWFHVFAAFLLRCVYVISAPAFLGINSCEGTPSLDHLTSPHMSGMAQRVATPCMASITGGIPRRVRGAGGV